jgi:hypothetical protein
MKKLTQEQYEILKAQGWDDTKIETVAKSQGYGMPQPGYLSRVGSQYKQARQDIMSGTQGGTEQYLTGVEDRNLLQATGGLLRSGLRTVGGVAKATFAPITEAPIIKQVLGGVGTGIQKLSETKPIQAVGDVFAPIAEVAIKHPEVAKDIQDAISVASLLYANKAKGGETVGKRVETVGKKIETQATGAIEKNKKKFLEDLVRPEQTKAIKEAQVSRTTEVGKGILKRSYIEPSKAEKASIEAIKSIKEVSPKNSYQQNFNIINKANTKEAIRLEKIIDKNDFLIPKKETLSVLNKTKSKLAESPLITGDAVKTADKLLAKATRLVQENGGSGGGLFKAKKAYDAWVKAQKPKAFDAKSENAFTIANREIRNAFGETIKAKAPPHLKKIYESSLNKQSALYDALDSIRVKAATEADTAIGRIFDKVGQALGVKSRVVQGTATAVGIGGLGAASFFAPIIAKLGGVYAVFRAGKWVLRPEARKAIGEVLQKSGNLIPVKERELLRGMIAGQAIKISRKDTNEK